MSIDLGSAFGKILIDAQDALDQAGLLHGQGEGAAHQAAADQSELIEHRRILE